MEVSDIETGQGQQVQLRCSVVERSGAVAHDKAFGRESEAGGGEGLFGGVVIFAQMAKEDIAQLLRCDARHIVGAHGIVEMSGVLEDALLEIFGV